MSSRQLIQTLRISLSTLPAGIYRVSCSKLKSCNRPVEIRIVKSNMFVHPRMQSGSVEAFETQSLSPKGLRAQDQAGLGC